MAIYVIVGHASFDQRSGPDPPVVLIPRDTTVTFFSEVRSGAGRSPDDDDDTAYQDDVAPAW